MDFEERTDTVAVPKHAGIGGLLATISGILKEIPKVRAITITNTGVVSYTWLAPAQEAMSRPAFAAYEFKDSQPSTILRRVPVQELPAQDESTRVALVRAIQLCSSQRLYPIAFVVGSPTHLWSQLEDICPEHDSLLGYAVHIDSELPPEAVVLCAGIGRSYELLDTHKAFKVSLNLQEGKS